MTLWCFAALDFRRYGKVSKGQENGPWRKVPARGPTRPWRTLIWLFLVGLRPRSARLRFTRRKYCRNGSGWREPLKNEDKERGNVEGGCIGPSSQEGEALACKASLSVPVDSAFIAER